jgi:hypothetical protein
MNPSQRIDQLIAEITDWRGKTFASMRKIILEADREIIEEWKWMGSPVCSAKSQAGVKFSVVARDRPRHHSATANEYCPSSSTVAR